MNIRESTEERELENLSPFASCSRRSRGRRREEEECDIRTVYQRDRDRILYSKSFRRLEDKTQVFLDYRRDHYRNRLTHTLEVSQTARTVAKALRLNEDLVEAIALGHDLGHTPFGHAGEQALNQVSRDGFVHNLQSVRVVEILENGGKGLNLTWEVRDGIKNHRISGSPRTLEGQVVRLCDKISYIHHDMDDAQRAGLLTEDDIPITLRMLLGYSTKERLNTLIHDIVESSTQRDEICMSPEVGAAMMELRTLMFHNVYQNSIAREEEAKARDMLVKLFHYFTAHPREMADDYWELAQQEGEPLERVVCDYISGMTDQDSMDKFNQIFVPKCWPVY